MSLTERARSGGWGGGVRVGSGTEGKEARLDRLLPPPTALGGMNGRPRFESTVDLSVNLHRLLVGRNHSRYHSRENSALTLLLAYVPIYRMVKTIRVSEEYHEWLNAHKEDGETMEETLRRMTRGPHPSDVAGLLSEAEADDAKAAVDRLRGGDRDRLEAARSAFDRDGTE